MSCRTCRETNPSEFYSKNLAHCKTCLRERARLDRLANPEKYAERDRKRYQNDPRVIARHKRYQETEAGNAAVNAAKKRWVDENPIKREASRLVCSAVRYGKMIKPTECSNCNKPSDRLEGHHSDYSKPLVVDWLCSLCHTEWHRVNGEGLNGE